MPNLNILFALAIPYNTGLHLKYFTKGRETYEVYYGYMIRCSSIWDIRHKPIMWAKMVHFLRTADSDRTADWWLKHWQGPWTLADAGYANCTHQNHQEGKWRPTRRGTGCGADGDERQSLGSFTSKLVRYARSASEAHEQQLIELGHPNAFVRNPTPSKREWDDIQSLHRKVLLCSFPLAAGMNAEDRDSYTALIRDICCTGLKSDPLYLKIQKFHALKLEDHLAAGGKPEDFKCRIRKKLLNTVIMPSKQLMYDLDPTGKRKLEAVHKALLPYVQEYRVFMDQHLDKHKATVDSWGIEKYLQVMDSMYVVTRIEKDDERWGELMFKCSCKACFVRCCCAHNLIWSMILNPTLVIPPKFAKLEPAHRKKRGRPTVKRVARLMAQEEDMDARPFVDKAAPRVSASTV